MFARVYPRRLLLTFTFNNTASMFTVSQGTCYKYKNQPLVLYLKPSESYSKPSELNLSPSEFYVKPFRSLCSDFRLLCNVLQNFI